VRPSQLTPKRTRNCVPFVHQDPERPRQTPDPHFFRTLLDLVLSIHLSKTNRPRERSILKKTEGANTYTQVRIDEEYSVATEVQHHVLPRKEVIQPQVLLRLPCYDFTPVTSPTFDSCLLADSSPASGVTGSHGVTGGVYKARERIQRGMLIRVY
jgi:hypothetical protein